MVERGTGVYSAQRTIPGRHHGPAERGGSASRRPESPRPRRCPSMLGVAPMVPNPKCTEKLGRSRASILRRYGNVVPRRWLVLVAAFLAAGCSGSGSRPVDEAVTDATIVSAVRARLASDEELAPYRIGVSALEGVVTLTGRVEREAQRDRAGRLAEEIEGIESVRNLIRVGGRGLSAPRSNV